jgi:hypothetical protein
VMVIRLKDWTEYNRPVYNILIDNVLIEANDTSNAGREFKFGVYSDGFRNRGIVIKDSTICSPYCSVRDLTSGHWHSDTFFYNNEISGAYYDPIELDGEGLNCAAWGNTVTPGINAMGDSQHALSLVPVVVGPIYIFRNTFVGCWDYLIKMGNSSTGWTYFYHNTLYNESSVYNWKGGLASYGNNSLLNNFVMRNNIVAVRQYRTYFGDTSGDCSSDAPWTTSADWTHFDWDYDLMAGSTIRFNGVNYDTFAAFVAATGHETHGIDGNLNPPNLTNPENGDFTLQSTSPCIDAGEILPGFNDANSPWPYSGAAPDIGAYEYIDGGPTNYPPVLNTIGNKTVNPEETLQFTISATDPNGDVLTYSATNLPTGATFNTTTRTFSWTPTSSQVGTYPNVRFTVSDGTLTDYENITITVNSSGNSPPVLASIGDQLVNTGQTLQFTVSATDADDDALTYSATNLPQGATFNTTTRTFSWTPTSSQSGTYSNVHFEVSDGTLTDYENITIIVTADTGLPPLLRVNAGGSQYTDTQGNTWLADQAYVSGSWGFYGTDNTVDRGTGHSISGTTDDRIYQTERYGLSGYRFDVGNGTYAVVLHFAETYLTGSGERVFDISIEGQLVLDNLDIYSEVGYSAALQKVFSGIIVQDGQLDIALASSIEQPEINGAEIFIAEGNHAPVLDSIGNKSVTEEELLTFTVTATDADDDPLTFSADNLPDGASFNTYTRVFSWTPTTDQAGTYPNVIFEVSDGELTDSENITITVLDSDNSAPVLDAIGNKSVREGQLLQFTVSATDPDEDELIYSASNLPTGATFNTTTRVFSWTPELDQRGSYPNVCFSVTDGALSDSEYITITVTANDPPTLGTIGNKSVREDEELEFTISATDSDDDPLTFSASNLPQGASFDAGTRTFSWTPETGDIGTYDNVHFEVSDGTWTDSEDITITVLSSANNAPVLDTIGDKSVDEGELLEFTISATDPDDDLLTFSASNLPQGASFNTGTRTFFWAPGSSDIGTYDNVHFEVSDDELTDSEDITITVLSIPNNAPVLDTIGDKSVDEGELLEFTISATDPDDDLLTFSASNLPQGASFNAGTRTFSWTPETGDANTYPNVHFEVSDGELTDSEDIIITVNTPTPPAGGGGGGTGGSDAGGGGGIGVDGDSGDDEPPADEPDDTSSPASEDTTPPVIAQIATSNVGTDSIVIRWTTTEPSTSQVEYWASPSEFSPLDETLVTEHVVRLTNLIPGTDYHYRTLSKDAAGNLATSPDYNFSTPGKPAAFTVRWLSISPAEANIGQEVTISVLVTNMGDATGSYDVVLSIDDVVTAAKSIVDLAGGASQEVAFTITADNVGVFTVSVNDATGTLVVSDAGEPSTAIELFDITPDYESDTGVINFARVDYGIYESYYSTLFSQLNAELVLIVGLDGEPLEEVTLITPGQSEPYMSTSSLIYTPPEGWTSATYSFQAELRTDEGVIETSPPVRLIITPVAAAGVASWATLGEIIGGVLIIALLAVLLILHRNRDMLRSRSLE